MRKARPVIFRILFAGLIALLAPTARGQDQAVFAIGGFEYRLTIAEEVTGGYRRADWRHWDTNVGGGCFTVRDKVLNEESFAPVRTEPASGGRCRVVEGLWHDAYTGRTFTDAQDIQIDHMVPLKEAHDSGGHAWTPERRQQYANDLTFADHLIAVHGPENGRKGDADPADYLPPNEAYRCRYLQNWVMIKARWGLSADPREVDTIRNGMTVWCR